MALSPMQVRSRGGSSGGGASSIATSSSSLSDMLTSIPHGQSSWAGVGNPFDFGRDFATNVAGFLSGRDYHAERMRNEDIINSKLAREQERDWNLADRAHDEARADSQIQRMVADARAAGINPLSLIGGSGSTGYGGQGINQVSSGVATSQAKTSNIIQSVVAALAAIALKKG